MSEIITCPSGLKGRIRKMKVAEAQELSNGGRRKIGDPLAKLLKGCWEETIDPGIYDFGDKPVDWGTVLLGDRLYVLMQIRILTYGPSYQFHINCGDRSCRSRILWEVNLDELPKIKLSDESRAVFQNGNRFETTLPEAGVKVWFKLLVGADEVKLARLTASNLDFGFLNILNYRIVEIDSVDPKDKRQFIEDLSMADADFLLSEFDRADCGVDSVFEIECRTCGVTQEVELPFDRTFLAPGRRNTGRRGLGNSYM